MPDTLNVNVLCTRNKVAEKEMYTLTQRMHSQKCKESLDACAQEGSSRVLHMVLTMTFSDFCVLNHAIKISLNVVFFSETNHYLLTSESAF